MTSVSITEQKNTVEILNDSVSTVQVTAAGPQGIQGATGAQGPSVSDGDKGDITVSNSGDTWTVDTGVIDNANINASAAIAGTKISPDFGSQNIETTGDLKIDNINKTVQVGDITNDNYVQLIQVASSSVRGFTNQHSNASVLENLQATTNQHIVLGDVNGDSSLTLFGISNTYGGTTTPKLTLSGSGNLAIQNNITLGGTVDGVDIAARNTLFGGLTSSSGVLTNGVTATTQSASDNSTKVATTAYTDTAISNLINGAPAALDTLNELAAAMNDDAAFSTTVTNSLATKLPLAGGQITGNITCSGSETFDGRDLSIDGLKLDGIATSANNYSIASDLLDEDDFTSNSATKVPSQQSVKAYVDANAGGANTNTTYSISCVDGDNTDEEKIRLTAGGSGSGTDDVVLEAGTGLSVARSGDKITFTNTSISTTLLIDGGNFANGTSTITTSNIFDGGDFGT